jgi:hypothetical protein
MSPFRTLERALCRDGLQLKALCCELLTIGSLDGIATQRVATFDPAPLELTGYAHLRAVELRIVVEVPGDDDVSHLKLRRQTRFGCASSQRSDDN